MSKKLGNNLTRIRIERAMQDPDGTLLEMVYESATGERTKRVVSPIKWNGSGRFLALCLCREEPRTFDFERCSGVQNVSACDYVMPVEIGVLSDD